MISLTANWCPVNVDIGIFLSFLKSYISIIPFDSPIAKLELYWLKSMDKIGLLNIRHLMGLVVFLISNNKTVPSFVLKDIKFGVL